MKHRSVHNPTDALFVAPSVTALPDGDPLRDETHLRDTGLLGSYRRRIGWGHGRTPSARTAVGPDIRPLPAVDPPATAG